MKVVLVTDSAAALPPEVVQRHGILVAPLSVTVDGVFEDDLSYDRELFYEQLANGIKATTSQPSPGALLTLYKRAAQDGAEQVISIHIGSKLSGTVGSARVAAASSPIPVEVVDSGTASFQQGLCVWEAADALAAGAEIAEVARVAVEAGRCSSNIFIVGALKFAAEGGRLTGAVAEGVPILTATEAGIVPVGSAKSAGEAVDIMADHIARFAAGLKGQRLRLGVTHIHAPEMAQTFKDKLSQIKEIEELMDYFLPPSMATHVGPGTVSAVYLPRPVR
ncbi:MAG: DegV family protein [Dehalococcoidia bacterium]